MSVPPPAGAETCALCPKMCRFACPVARARASEAVHPTGLARAAVGALRGTLPWEEAGPLLYECSMCLGCRTPCALDQDVPAWLRAARSQAVARGGAPAAVMEVGRRAEATGSPYGVDASQTVAALVREAMQTDAPGETDVVYVPSCTAVAREPRVAMAMVGVLQAAGVGVRVVHPSCCGALLADLGHPEVAERMRRQVAEAAARARGGEVVCDGPRCAAWLQATPFAVVAARLLEAGRLRPRRIGVRAAYHDPCWLGRGLGVYEEPRAVLAAVAREVAEAAHAREAARCSGGGGGLPATDPQAAAAAAAERAAELAATGAEVVVTACAQAKRQLRGAGLAVRDLAEVLGGAV